jgi:DNA-binding MarR family transcriptional regulator
MENLSYLLIKASRHLKNSLDKRLSAYDITASQFSVLNQIYNSKGNITSAEIAAILESDRPTISGIINRLEQKKLLEKVVNPKDKRSAYLKLTQTTMDLVEKLRLESDQLNEEIFSVLEDGELRAMKSALLKVIRETEKI